MLGLADPEHVDPSDRSAAKNWRWLCMQRVPNCQCWISS